MEILFPVFVSLFVQVVKQTKWFDKTWKVLGLVALTSLVAAVVYTSLVAVGLWQAFIGILVIAGAIYTYIIQRFE